MRLCAQPPQGSCGEVPAGFCQSLLRKILRVARRGGALMQPPHWRQDRLRVLEVGAKAGLQSEASSRQRVRLKLMPRRALSYAQHVLSPHAQYEEVIMTINILAAGPNDAMQTCSQHLRFRFRLCPLNSCCQEIHSAVSSLPPSLPPAC